MHYLRILALVIVVSTGGCAGTAMESDSGVGAGVPTRGWEPGPWYVDPAWRGFGPIGTDDFRAGPWWHDDPVWGPFTIGQRNGRARSEAEATPAAPAAPAATQPDAGKPSSN